MKRNDILEVLIESSAVLDIKKEVIEEIQAIENKEVSIEQEKQLPSGSLGCTYKKGAFIVDFNGGIIYKQFFPAYFKFLRRWYFDSMYMIGFN